MLKWNLGGLLIGGMLMLLCLVQPALAEVGCEKQPGRLVIDQLLNLDLAGAKAELSRWQRREPGDPMLGFYSALTTLSVGYIESGHDDEFRKQLSGKALKQLKRVVAKTEGEVEGGGGDPRATLAYGMAQAFSSVLHTIRKETLASYNSGHKGVEVLDQLVAAHPEIEDPYLVLGLFNYYVGILPEKMKWKTKMLGMSGDRDTGIAYLERAIESAPATGPEAARVLLMDLELPETEQCRYRSLAELMRDRYPNNVLFPVYARVYDLQCRIAEKEGELISSDMPFSLNEGCR
ncbi:MAG: hypothetical protein ACWA5X_06470 [bacterium]